MVAEHTDPCMGKPRKAAWTPKTSSGSNGMGKGKRGATPPQWNGSAPDRLSSHPCVLAAELEAEELAREDGADLLLAKLNCHTSQLESCPISSMRQSSIHHHVAKLKRV
eukprot:3319550-Amphidinium_carterae.1